MDEHDITAGLHTSGTCVCSRAVGTGSPHSFRDCRCERIHTLLRVSYFMWVVVTNELRDERGEECSLVSGGRGPGYHWMRCSRKTGSTCQLLSISVGDGISGCDRVKRDVITVSEMNAT